MASKCPKCGQWLEEEYICCAEVEFTWKCMSCGKLSKGFVVPFGRCHLCGGQLDKQGDIQLESKEEISVIHQAIQMEIDNLLMYKAFKDKVTVVEIAKLFQELYEEELGHIAELEKKYHIKLNLEDYADPQTSKNVFLGVEIDQSIDSAEALLDKAILMEKRAKEYYQNLANNANSDKKRDIYRALAAEEEEHQALLETKKQNLV